MRRCLSIVSLLVLACVAPAAAQSPTRVKVGVLTDASGPFADQSGHGSQVAAQLAAEDFMAKNPAIKVEILFGDHQNKPDVGSAVVHRWVDEDNIDAVVDVPNSGVALAINDYLAGKHRTFLASGVATSDLTGKYCKSTTVQWVRDTWALANAQVKALASAGSKSWFFLSYDYALGRALEADATAALTKLGGKVVGSVRHPVNVSDFASYLLQAQSSGADVVALADTGNDAINAIKQASEFGLQARGQKLASLFLELSDIDGLGLSTAQGLTVANGFYWDLNETTRAWAKRFGERMNGRMPTDDQAGVYSSTLAYLDAVARAGTVDGETVVAQIRAQPIDDPLYGPTTVRIDGRAVHAMNVFRVKSPTASKARWDYFELISTVPAAEAFRPLADGGCPLVK